VVALFEAGPSRRAGGETPRDAALDDERNLLRPRGYPGTPQSHRVCAGQGGVCADDDALHIVGGVDLRIVRVRLGCDVYEVSIVERAVWREDAEVNVVDEATLAVGARWRVCPDRCCSKLVTVTRYLIAVVDHIAVGD